MSKSADEPGITIRCSNCHRDSSINSLKFPFDEYDDISTSCEHCNAELHFGDYAKWTYPHQFREQIRYSELTEVEVQQHFRHIAAQPGESSRMELHICGTEASVSVRKHKLQTKSDRLSFLLRTSSVGSERLSQLKEMLESDGYELRLRHSAKRKLLSQVSVLLPIDDPMMSVKATNLIQAVAKALKSPHEITFEAGYALGHDGPGLPGRKTTSGLTSMFGVKVGFLLGCIVGFIGALIFY